jgi:hypothetical protein
MSELLETLKVSHCLSSIHVLSLPRVELYVVFILGNVTFTVRCFLRTNKVCQFILILIRRNVICLHYTCSYLPPLLYFLFFKK